MSARRFGAITLFADVDVVLMEGAADTNSTVNVRFVNHNSGTKVNVRLAMVDASAATAIAELLPEDYLDYNAEIAPWDILEDTGIVVPAGYSLVARSNTSDVNVIAYGFEEQC